MYRISGWIAASDSATVMRDLDELTESRVAIRVYAPAEVPSIRNGREKVPVQYRHGPFVKSFERMIFQLRFSSYGTIDPEPKPVVAFFSRCCSASCSATWVKALFFSCSA